MTARTIIYSQEQMRSFDFVQAEHDILLAMAQTMQDVCSGQGTGVITGLAATQTGSPSLTINIAAGAIYQAAAADAVAVGAIPQDTTSIFQQGTYAGGTLTLSTSGISSGQSRWTLIQAQFQQIDQVRPSDPNGGVLLYFNAANPAQPLQGSGGLGGTQNTMRNGVLVLQQVNGSAATTGTETPPNATAGWVPVYLVDLAFGQTQILTANILTAGPSVGTGVPSNYPNAPFLAGLLASHHGGTPGQAPKIKLVSEVQGVLPMANLPVSSSATNAGISTVYEFSGNPNGSVAGVAATATTPPDLVWDRTNGVLYACTTTGNAAAAVWKLISGGQQPQIQVFTAGGTFTTPASTGTSTRFKFTVVGGGGAGGNAPTQNNSGGGGGGAGATAIYEASGLTAGSTCAVTVGAGGTGVAGTGGAGTASSVVVGATTVTAGGGAGGTGGSSGNTSAGGAGGTATNGTFNITGGGGANGWGGLNLGASGGQGGASSLAGGAPGGNGTGPSAAATAYGAGGAGFCAGNLSTGSGGNGAPGIVIVEWFA